MSKVIKLKKGLDIKLNGEAEKTVVQAAACATYALKPTDFRALTPRLAVKAGDVVKAGDSLFTDKANPDVKFTSPVSGTVSDVVRGERRRLMEVVVKADSTTVYKDFGKADVNTLSREQVIAKMLESGVWPMVIQRPYGIIANPAVTPKAVFVSGFDSAPLAPDYAWMLKDDMKDLQTGIDCLKKLCGKDVNLGLCGKCGKESPLAQLKNTEVTFFEGPHPAGNVGVQISHVAPINKGEHVWTVNIQDVAIIGHLFNSGHFDARKTVAVAGSEVTKPAYAKTILGANVASLIGGNTKGQTHERVISGNVLTGEKVAADGFLGYYANQVTVIPEGDDYELLGWAMPGFNKFSASRLFFSKLCPNKHYTLNANYHGERRAFVVTGEYERVLPMDILPVYLLKACLAGDIDSMEQLGIYEVLPEDFALCEFVCTSKTPVQNILEQGIELMMKETN